MKKPNIIFILSDQHNAKITGYNGHADVKTPNMDKLAANGVSCNSAITQNPICTPSRVSWLSGQYCHNHGYYGLSGPNPNGLPTILGHFRKYGYRTGAIGKIHCPEYWVEDDCDTFLEARGCSIGGSPEWQEHINELGYDNSGVDRHKSPIGGQCLDGVVSELKYINSQEKFIVNRTIDFIEESLSEDKPFIIHTSFGKPHQPYMPSEEFWSLYDEENLTLPPNFQYSHEEGKKAPHFMKMAREHKKGEWTVFEPKNFMSGARRKLRGYLGCISQVDQAVGDIVQYLKEKGLENDTILIYSSDHGDYACEHGIMEKAPGICSDAITRVPLLWHWPDHFKPGHIVNELVQAVDMSNTLCSLCGIDKMVTSDGKDISQLLNGSQGEIHEYAVTEFAFSKSIRKGNFRFVYYPREMFKEAYPEGFGELYNLEEDPWEMNNLYFEKEYGKKVDELQKDLMEWLITTTRPKTVLQSTSYKGDQGYTRYNNTVNGDGKMNPERIVMGGNYT
jgi:arylsulfatase